jgi:N-acetylglucosamine-6-phosphate deacetylase
MSQRGAQDAKFIKNPDEAEYIDILNRSKDIVRWSAAPELKGALKFGERLRERGILPAIAHTDAKYEEVLKAFECGFTHVTHLYSAMSTIRRINAYRHAGVVEAAYLIDDMTVEIIADGAHLPTSLLKFVYKFKGADKTALITDSTRAAGMPEGESVIGSRENGQRVIIEDGVAKLPDRSAFAGSVATADRLVKTMIELADVTICDAVKMATLTPAKIIGVSDRKGKLAAGYDADVLIFDENIDVKTTVVKGKVVYEKK